MSLAFPCHGFGSQSLHHTWHFINQIASFLSTLESQMSTLPAMYRLSFLLYSSSQLSSSHAVNHFSTFSSISFLLKDSSLTLAIWSSICSSILAGSMFPDSMASITYSFADQFVDILTKGLSTLLFRRHCSNLMLGSSKHMIAEECQDIKGSASATSTSATCQRE